MNKIRPSLLAAAFVGLLLPAGAAAQGVLIGAKAGVNSATLSLEGSDVPDTESLTGFVGGLFAQFNLGQRFAIRPEALISNKGSKASADGADLEVQANYVEIPVLLALRLGNEGGIRPQIFAGPVMSFESSCKAKATGAVSFDLDCMDSNGIDLETKSSDFGGAAGVGLEIPLGGLSIVGDARYTFGFSDIADDDEVSAKNRAWSFMAGAALGIG